MTSPREPAGPAPGAGTSAASDTGRHEASYGLLEALLNRRSRRFGRGMHLDGGPLSYKSEHVPQPLSVEEEAALAFAACGITGPVLGELPYKSGSEPETGGGNIMTHLVGRTVASGDAMHCVTMFVLNDDGGWMLRRPQDYPRAEIAELAALSREHRFVELYQRSRVRVADQRPQVARRLPHVPSFNRWSANVPGTTYFLPVAELTGLYINLLLSVFDEEYGCFVYDDRHGLRPAGLGRFARSRGGHLHDDPALERVGTIDMIETWLLEFAALEQGQMLQNLGLMAAALDVGGFMHFAAHPYGWMQALGFRMVDVPISTTTGMGPLRRSMIRLLRKDMPIPTAVGLERGGEVLIRPFCPPYYATMSDAVHAFVDYKLAAGTGTLRDGGAHTAWRDGAAVQAGMPHYSERSIAATIAYCEYVYERFGRFPAATGPFRTTLAYQAQHLDPDFYNRYYKPGVGE